MSKRIVKVYPRFERVWHWTQMVLIMVLMVTGFGLNGVHNLIPFGPAVMFHTMAALALLCIWIFATFWLFTTGTWKQFVPQLDGMMQVMRFYAYGVFKGEKHPYKKQYWRKHNPLQIFAYFGLKICVFPMIWGTGILYMTYNFWADGDASFALYVIANLHLLAAYVIAAFVVIHVYMLTIGHGFREHVRPMISGYEEVDLTPEQEAYLEANEPDRLMPRQG
ncbi:cytochrome b/b6 domain-containing protein [Aliiroseovarius crassostreae]|uniref:cytochrome b/b6 domain-containing protein n=1 Tax=Aliiroseovarius crassostreae TaxID=154981 RepID=UPI003C7D88A8